MKVAGSVIPLGLALVGGGLIGIFYFGSLWLVVRRLAGSAWPAVWLGVTGILRLAVVVALFMLLLGSGWERLMVALAGFFAVRVVLARRLGRSAEGDHGGRRDRAATGGGL
jgi:F1F0 ATPase subunit 2